MYEEQGIQIILDLYAFNLFCFRQQLRVHSTLIVLVRRNAGNALSHVHARTLWGRARRGRQQDGVCCHRLCEPFVLLESRIRNVFAPYKNGKKP